MNKGWVKEVDILKGIAILAVIVTHVMANFTRIKPPITTAYTALAIDSLSWFAVPLFIFLTGFTLSIKYFNSFNVMRFYYKRFIGIIPLYVAISLIYIIFVHEITEPRRVWEVLFVTYGAYYHTWFIKLIIGVYILYPVLIRIYAYFDSKNKAGFFVLAVLVLQLAFVVSSQYLPFKYPLSNYGNAVLSYWFYLFYGIYVYRKYGSIEAWSNSLRSKWLMVVTAYIVLYAIVTTSFILGLQESQNFDNLNRVYYMAQWYLNPFLFAAQFMVLALIVCIAVQKVKWLADLLNDYGVHSFEIYLFHVFFVLASERILSHNQIYVTMPSFYVISSIFTVVMSYFCVKVFRGKKVS